MNLIPAIMPRRQTTSQIRFRSPGKKARWNRSGAEEDAEEDDCDAEPSLGSVENHPNGYLDGSDCGRGGKTQECWASGNRDDCEGDEHDGREHENEGGEAVREDCEPNLGWTDAEAATGRHTGWGGETYDLEVDL